MKRFIIFVVIILSHSICMAGDPISGYGTLVAIEFRTNNVFNNAVGKLEYTGTSIDIVGFTEGVFSLGIIATPSVYIVKEKTVRAQGFHYINGENQYGVTITGYIDFRNELKPQVPRQYLPG